MGAVIRSPLPLFYGSGLHLILLSSQVDHDQL